MIFQGFNDILCLTQPEIIEEIHTQYIEAGLTSLKPIHSTPQPSPLLTITWSTWHMKSIWSLRVLLERRQIRLFKRMVGYVGLQAIGPTNRTASISPKVEDPGYRNVSFEELAECYFEAAKGLMDGGADVLLIETIFDTLNAKAALVGVQRLEEETGQAIPIMLSGTITDSSGRTLSGQTTTAFWNSVRHVNPLSVGLIVHWEQMNSANMLQNFLRCRMYLYQLIQMLDYQMSLESTMIRRVC